MTGFSFNDKQYTLNFNYIESIMNNNVIVREEFEQLFLSQDCGAYRFRTRLERVLLRVRAIALGTSPDILELVDNVRDKLSYCTDQSNQTGCGSWRMFKVLEADLLKLKILLTRN